MKKNCPNCKTKLSFVKKTGTFEDINGNKHVRYQNYKCDGCSLNLMFDRLKNVWY